MAKTLAQALKAKEERLAKEQAKNAGKSHGVTAGCDPGMSSDKAQGSEGVDESKLRLLSIYGPKPKPHGKPKAHPKARQKGRAQAKSKNVKKTILKKPAAKKPVEKQSQGSDVKNGDPVNSEDEPYIFAVCPSTT